MNNILVDMDKKYTNTEIDTMNYGKTWNHCILKDKELSNKNKGGHFELHPTGYCDLNGRKYISLPAGTIITDKIKEKYNII